MRYVLALGGSVFENLKSILPGLPAMKVNGKRVSYSEYVSDMKAIRVMREYDRQTGGAGAALTDEQMSDQVLWRLANNVLVEEAAKELGLTRQGLYYWIKKGWVTPKRDYKGHPVFTKDDLRKINHWRDTLSEG